VPFAACTLKLANLMFGQGTAELHSMSTTAPSVSPCILCTHEQHTLICVCSPTPVQEGQVAKLELGGLVFAVSAVRLIKVNRRVHTVELDVPRDHIRDVATASAATSGRSAGCSTGPRFEVYLDRRRE
jgi:hypothetical protein